MTEIIGITGMSCAACTAAVERAVKKLPGITEAAANLVTDSLSVTYDEMKTSRVDIEAAVRSAGYGIRAPKQEASPSPVSDKRADALALRRRFVISLCFFIPVLYMHLAGMLGLPLGGLSETYPAAVGLTQLLLLIPIIITGRSFYAKGFRALAALNPNMDSLVALSTGISTAYGLYSLYALLITGAGGVPAFESPAMILTLVTFGKWLEKRSLAKTGDALDGLLKLTPQTASLLNADGTETVTDANALKAGDLCAVRSGDIFPADGTVVRGEATADESSLTGESIPAEKSEGSKVLAASVCVSGYAVIRCENVGSSTFIAREAALVEAASASKPPIATLADKISGIFVPAVTGLALLTFVLQLTVGQCGFETALRFAVAVLTVSCPCALGLATPAAVSVGTGTAARNGILIRDAAVFELLGHAETVFFDKTGTLTEGRLTVTDTNPAEGITETELLTADMSAEQFSSHPAAAANIAYGETKGIKPLDCDDYEAYPGAGIRAMGKDGTAYYAGNAKLMRGLIPDFAEAAGSGGLTTYVASAKDGTAKYLGRITARDTVRADAGAAIEALHKEGLKCVMLSGDTETAADAVGKSLGLDEYRGGLLPSEKTELLQGAKGISIMVGDGVNDSAALKTADVGIAMGTGTDIAMESASIVIPGTELSAVADAVRLGKSVLRKIRGNLFWAFIYNIICIPIAAGAFYRVSGLTLSPGLAALCMSLSSFCVVTNALRISRFKPLSRFKNNNGYLDLKVSAHMDAESGKENSEKTMTRRIYIEGMHCEHCAAAVKKALEAFEGAAAEVNLQKKYADVTLANEVADDELMSAVKEAGFSPVSVEEPAEKRHGLFGGKK